MVKWHRQHLVEMEQMVMNLIMDITPKEPVVQLVVLPEETLKIFLEAGEKMEDTIKIYLPLQQLEQVFQTDTTDIIRLVVMEIVEKVPLHTLWFFEETLTSLWINEML